MARHAVRKNGRFAKVDDVRPHKHVLCLQGGAAKAIWQAKRIAIRHENGERWDSVVGTSAGALNGLMVAMGMTTGLMALWASIDESKVFKRRSNLDNVWLNTARRWFLGKAPPLGLYNTQPLYDLLCEVAIGQTTVLPLIVGTVNLENGGQWVEWVIPAGTVIQDAHVRKVLASAALPVAFPPVEIDGALHVDGGVRNNAPLGTALDLDPTHITLILCSPREDEPQRSVRPTSAIEVGALVVPILMDENGDNDLSEYLKLNEVAAIVQEAHETGSRKVQKILSRIRYRHVPIEIDEPDQPLGDSLDFSKETQSWRVRLASAYWRESETFVLIGSDAYRCA